MVDDNSLPLRIVFFGTPEFAVPSLEALLSSRHTVAAVVTQPDRPSGRGQRVTPSPVKQLALSHGLPVLQPERLREPGFAPALAAFEPCLGVVAAYGKIIPDAVLAMPRLGMINVHASVLPKYRGAAPVQRAVMAGESETGISIIRLVKDLDAGPVLDIARRPIGPDETSEAVERDLARLGASLMLSVVDRLAANQAVETPQDHIAATHAPRLTKEEGQIDWRRTAAEVHNHVRGLLPWPRASTHVHRERLIILRTAVVDPPAAGTVPQDREPGEVLEAGGDQLVIATGAGGAIRILELQPPGGRPMSARAFLAGRKLPERARFGPPDEAERT
jgi:methionyl-tRNA formyltransferase